MKVGFCIVQLGLSPNKGKRENWHFSKHNIKCCLIFLWSYVS